MADPKKEEFKISVTPASPFEDNFSDVDLSQPPQKVAFSKQHAPRSTNQDNEFLKNIQEDRSFESHSSFDEIDPLGPHEDTMYNNDEYYSEFNEFTQKRSRWGTHRHGKRPENKTSRKDSFNLGRQVSQMLRINDSEQKRANLRKQRDQQQQEADKTAEQTSDTGSTDGAGLRQRTLYFNRPLPSEMLDEEGLPLEMFPRNKIRTTKYTPLTFIPKNLIFQFKNIANIYFMFIVILGAFPIFGVENPGLAAVPIVVIVIITMIKDAIEDYRRTLMDLDVNNGLTEILNGYKNPNALDDHVGPWRRFKKANTRLVHKFGQWIEERKADRVERKTGKRPQTKAVLKREMLAANDVASIYSRESFELGPRRPSTTNNAVTSDVAGDPESFMDYSIPISDNIRFRTDYWKNVKVGDFIRIRSDQEIPADMVILATSEDDGACYVETKNLDGETNLKNRQALQCGREIKHGTDCQRANFWLESEQPLPNLYAYNGVAKWYDVNDELRAEPVNINNLLLRGCMLRNTKWAVGVVVFTGPESKIMLNSGQTPTKRSFIQRNLNVLVIYNFGFMFLLCFISGLVNGIMRRNKNSTFSLFEFGSPGGSPPADGVVTFWASLILFQSLVPISLYISIEIVKTAQAFFIYSDVYMYYEPIDYPCTPKSWNISDDLGQIEYVFSDKTGTLTQNCMEFKKCTVNGVAYGKAYTEALAGMRKRQGVNVDVESKEMEADIAADRKQMLMNLKKMSDNKQRDDDEVTFVSNAYIQDLQGAHGQEQAEQTKHFMLALALCNTVITEKDDSGRNVFKAQSPDESALVNTARDMGFSLLERTRKGLLVDVHGKVIEYPLLTTLEFNSTRKRMSAIVRDPETGKILLLCKGADSVIYGRLKPNEQEELRRQTAIHLEEFANEGLRTLCVAQREITPKEFEAFNLKHERAAAEIVDREEKLEEVASEIETNLSLIGGTAIEDKLQDGVPRTVQLLGDAGIKMWVLTGDKVETAINIGFSCNLLTNEMQLLTIKIENDDKGSVPAQIDEFLFRHFRMEGSYEELEQAKLNHNVPSSRFAVVIDGDALKLALNPAIQHKFLLLCKQCRSVLCCRVSPSQKAAVVRMVRATLDVITLSIGDGANDVAMIQEANVGVGIAGEEGRQAVMCSDYAIGQFRFLARLLLVHGRYSYRRLAEMVPNFFYKNALFTLTLFWYGIFNNFDSTYLYDYTFVMFFNLAFTSLPVIIMGIIDQDVPDRISLAVPQLYRRGILRKDFSHVKFWLYMGEGFYQSFVCFFFPYFMYFDGRFVDKLGYPGNHRFWMGLATCTLSVMSCNLYVLTNQYRWDWFSLIVSLISTFFVWIWTGIYNCFTASAEFYGIDEVFTELNFWSVVLLGSVTCMLFHFMFMTVRALWIPQDVDIIREQWGLGEFDTVMSTPLAADDPDAANYENPYRPDTQPKTIQAPLDVLHRRTRHDPYEIRNDSHESILRSPDVVRIGDHTFDTERIQWNEDPFSNESSRNNSMTIEDLVRQRTSIEQRRSLDVSRRNTVWEQAPQPGIKNVEATRGLEEELTTAVGLLDTEGRTSIDASRRASRELSSPFEGRSLDIDRAKSFSPPPPPPR